MKRLFLPIALAASTASLIAEPVIYSGSWTNNTFKTTGPMTIELELTETAASVMIDLDGPVFGGGDPAPFSFTAPLDGDGDGSVTVTGTEIGDLTGSFTGDGNVAIEITNIPGGFLTKVEMGGTFDLDKSTFTGNYEIFTGTDSFALGDLEAKAPAAPEIAIEQPSGTGLSDGSSAIDFGTVETGNSNQLTFTIKNQGRAELSGLAIGISGSHPSDFTVGGLGSTTLAPDASTTFTVTFTPAASGNRTATIQVGSNDADENPFDITLSGTGTTPPAPPGDSTRNRRPTRFR